MLNIDGCLQRTEGVWTFQAAWSSDQVTAVMGPSGSGKTSLLRVLAGLEPAFEGSIHWQGRPIQRQRRGLPPHRRRFAWVPQQAPLMPHLNVRQHLALSCSDHDPAWWRQVLTGLNLEHLLTRPTATLSGGERQRVALGQAILSNPRMLLLDEPLANIDWQGRRQILSFLRTLQVPMVYVSHALDEVLVLAKQVILMGDRCVRTVLPVDAMMSDPGKWGLPVDALCSIFDARVEERDANAHLIRVSCNGTSLWLADGGQSPGESMLVKIVSRDVSLMLERPRGTSMLNVLPAVVQDWFEVSDAHVGVRLLSGDLAFIALITKRSRERLNLRKGMHLFAQLKAAVLS